MFRKREKRRHAKPIAYVVYITLVNQGCWPMACARREKTTVSMRLLKNKAVGTSVSICFDSKQTSRTGFVGAGSCRTSGVAALLIARGFYLQNCDFEFEVCAHAENMQLTSINCFKRKEHVPTLNDHGEMETFKLSLERTALPTRSFKEGCSVWWAMHCWVLQQQSCWGHTVGDPRNREDEKGQTLRVAVSMTWQFQNASAQVRSIAKSSWNIGRYATCLCSATVEKPSIFARKSWSGCRFLTPRPAFCEAQKRLYRLFQHVSTCFNTFEQCQLHFVQFWLQNGEIRIDFGHESWRCSVGATSRFAQNGSCTEPCFNLPTWSNWFSAPIFFSSKLREMKCQCLQISKVVGFPMFFILDRQHQDRNLGISSSPCCLHKVRSMCGTRLLQRDTFTTGNPNTQTTRWSDSIWRSAASDTTSHADVGQQIWRPVGILVFTHGILEASAVSDLWNWPAVDGLFKWILPTHLVKWQRYNRSWFPLFGIRLGKPSCCLCHERGLRNRLGSWALKQSSWFLHFLQSTPLLLLLWSLVHAILFSSAMRCVSLLSCVASHASRTSQGSHRDVRTELVDNGLKLFAMLFF